MIITSLSTRSAQAFNLLCIPGISRSSPNINDLLEEPEDLLRAARGAGDGAADRVRGVEGVLKIEGSGEIDRVKGGRGAVSAEDEVF